MKKIVLGFFGLLLVGAGCFGKGQRSVEGDWWLAFDLPEGWVMSRPYDVRGEGYQADAEVDRQLSDVILQSTDKTVVTTGSLPTDQEGVEYVTDDYVYVVVTHLDARRLLPEEAEDLGDGFSRVYLCEGQDDGCMSGSRADYDYYYLAENGDKYKFTVYEEGRGIDEAEEVILSAREVTVE